MKKKKKRSPAQIRATLRNHAKMRIAGAASIQEMLTEDRYNDVFELEERLVILNVCIHLEKLLKTWGKR